MTYFTRWLRFFDQCAGKGRALSNLPLLHFAIFCLFTILRTARLLSPLGMILHGELGQRSAGLENVERRMNCGHWTLKLMSPNWKEFNRHAHKRS